MEIRSWLDLAEKTIFSGLKLEEVSELGLKFKPGKDWHGLIDAIKNIRPMGFSYESMASGRELVLKEFLEGNLTNESDL
jgi:hypothetical protein